MFYTENTGLLKSKCVPMEVGWYAGDVIRRWFKPVSMRHMPKTPNIVRCSHKLSGENGFFPGKVEFIDKKVL